MDQLYCHRAAGPLDHPLFRMGGCPKAELASTFVIGKSAMAF